MHNGRPPSLLLKFVPYLSTKCPLVAVLSPASFKYPQYRLNSSTEFLVLMRTRKGINRGYKDSCFRYRYNRSQQ